MVVFIHKEELPRGMLCVEITLPADTSKQVKTGLHEYVGSEFESRPHIKNEDVVEYIIGCDAYERFCELLETVYQQPTSQGILNSETVGTIRGHEGIFPALLLPTRTPALQAWAYTSADGPGIYFSFCSPHLGLEEHLKAEVGRPFGRARKMRYHHATVREVFLPTAHTPAAGEISSVVERAVAAYGEDISRFVYGSVKKV